MLERGWRQNIGGMAGPHRNLDQSAHWRRRQHNGMAMVGFGLLQRYRADRRRAMTSCSILQADVGTGGAANVASGRRWRADA